jgi:glycosyltransferase involved in cell wall biosynthesis
LRQLVFAYPGDLATITGGYIYDRKLIEALQVGGWEVAELSLGAAFPGGDFATFGAAADLLSAVETGVPVIVDGLALGADPRLADAAARRGPLIALVHHPLALETGLEAVEANRLRLSETQALRFADQIVVTSDPTAATLIEDYGVRPDRLSIAKPGNDRPPFARGSGGPKIVLLSVAAISPRKGFDVLVQALERIKDLPWRLDLVGNEAIDPPCAAALRHQISAAGLDGRIRHWGAMDQAALAARYDAADVFVLASRYEGYGMVYSEAIAHGLPVIGTTGGAIPSVVPKEAGLLAEPGDVETLVEALRVMITDTLRRDGFAAGSRAAAAHLPSWAGAAQTMAAAITAASRNWGRR